MRKFYLQNAAGGRIDLNGATGVWLTEPTGLGMSFSPTVADYKKGFFSIIYSDSEPQGSIDGTLTFSGGSPYVAYRSFVDWIIAAGSGLQIVYCPNGTQEYYKKVTLTSISKTEISKPNRIETSVVFSALTPWYSSAKVRVDMVPVASGRMRYPYTYSAGLFYATSNAGAMSANLEPTGHIPSAVKFVYSGALSNPVLSLVGADSGVEHGACAINADLSGTDTLTISTVYMDSYVIKTAADGTITDLLGNVDVSRDPYFRLPLDETCILTLSSDAAMSGAGEVTLYTYYKSV